MQLVLICNGSGLLLKESKINTAAGFLLPYLHVLVTNCNIEHVMSEPNRRAQAGTVSFDEH